MADPADNYDRVISGDWSSFADEVCPGDGHLEVWDQTIGCPVCGQNLWNLPMTVEEWPAWDRANAPAADNWERRDGHNPYTVYMRIFDRRHPTPMRDDDEVTRG